ncbi:uncharacterized protein LOC142344807 isoform X3 [Convolutriloba macropyga]|uniref:uncharacterized protein LOC142344807 isoform X3 n=1 Tax=Convolutriloba macropyga TaxID=536237 RepID=UPI003F51C170
MLGLNFSTECLLLITLSFILLTDQANFKVEKSRSHHEREDPIKVALRTHEEAAAEYELRRESKIVPKPIAEMSTAQVRDMLGKFMQLRREMYDNNSTDWVGRFRRDSLSGIPGDVGCTDDKKFTNAMNECEDDNIQDIYKTITDAEADNFRTCFEEKCTATHTRQRLGIITLILLLRWVF